MAESYPDLVELITRLDGKDKKTVELALYCLNKTDAQNAKLRSKVQAVVAENLRLREALKPFARLSYSPGPMVIQTPLVSDINEARAAIRGNENVDGS